MRQLRHVYLRKVVHFYLRCHIFVTYAADAVERSDFFEHIFGLCGVKDHLVGIGYPIIGKELEVAEKHHRFVGIDAVYDLAIALFVQITVAGIDSGDLHAAAFKKECRTAEKFQKTLIAAMDHIVIAGYCQHRNIHASDDISEVEKFSFSAAVCHIAGKTIKDQFAPFDVKVYIWSAK